MAAGGSLAVVLPFLVAYTPSATLLTSFHLPHTRSSVHRARAVPIVAKEVRTITDEARETIIELVQLDAELVAEQMQRQGAKAAWKLARTSFERRWPLIEWLVMYNVDKSKLRMVEAAQNCTLLKVMTPRGYSELHWQRSHLNQRLVAQRSQLVMALVALRPALRQRLLEAVSERPALIPSVGKRALASGVVYGRWLGNRVLRFGKLRSREAFEATRAALIEKWLQVRWCMDRYSAHFIFSCGSACIFSHAGTTGSARSHPCHGRATRDNSWNRRSLAPSGVAPFPTVPRATYNCS